jgi:MGT family glycosyltransferase
MTQARRFLFAIVEGGGNVPVQLGLVRRLVGRGHEVRVLADPASEGEVHAAGGVYLPWRRAPAQNMRSREHDRVRDWEARSPIAALRRLGDELFFGPAPRYAEDLLEAIAAWPPDVLAIDQLLHGAQLAAEKSGLPSALLMHSTCLLDLPGLPPYGLGLRPARGPLGRLRDAALKRVLHAIFDRIGRGRMNRLRAEHGLPPLAHALDQLARLDRVLVMTSPAFDFEPARAPDHVRYVGPVLDDPAWVEPWRSPFAAGDARPLVVVALGSTFQAQRTTLARLVEALAALPVRGLVTLGGVLDPADLPGAPNVRVVASAPHAEVFPQARVVVAHGGHGTVMKALAAGAPLLCVPLGRDQVDNGARIEVRGVGLRVARNARAATYRRALERLLADDRTRDAALRLGETIRREAAACAAVDELESLARVRTGVALPGRTPSEGLGLRDHNL